MAEFVIPPAPPVSPNILVGGDAQFQDNTIINWSNTTVEFGADSSKTPVERGMVTQYDTGTIPLGNDLVIKRAKLEMMPSATYTGSFDANIDVMALNTRLDPVDIVDQDAQFIFRPMETIFGPVLWSDGRASGEDITLYKYASTGIGNLTQAWTASDDGTLRWHTWYLERTGTLSGMSISCNLWSATGSAGAWRKNELLDTGVVYSGTDPDTMVNSGSPVATYFRTASASGYTSIVSGNKYISELVTTGGVLGRLGVNLLSTASNGDSDNLSVLAYDVGGARKISSFQERCQWLTGSQIQAAAKAGTTGDAGIAIPTFTLNTLYTFGNPGSDDDSYISDPVAANQTALPNFMADLQIALRARTSRNQWIGVRFTPVISTTASNDRRVIKSVRNTGTTVGSYTGMVLTIEYEDPPPFVVQPPPRSVPGIQVQPLDRAEDEYDLESEEVFRRGLEGELLKLSRAVNEATELTGGVSSSASKRERFLPKVGKVTVG